VKASARSGAVLVLGLAGCGSAAEDAGDPSETGGDGAPTNVIDEEGFETAPEVAFPAPAATGFGGGHLLCRERRSEITPELANVLGFDVAADRAVLEATQVLDVLASWDDVRPTAVHYRGRIARILRVDRRSPVGFSVEEAVPVGCPSGVEYELVQQLYTEDGAVRGAFLARVPATQLDEPTARGLSAIVDLRNFTGQVPVGWCDTADQVVAAARVRWTVGAIEPPEFELSFTLSGGSDYYGCDWAFCRDDSDLVLPISYGIVAGPSLESFDDLLTAFGDVYTPSSLAEYPARTLAYTPKVRIWVTANGANTTDPSSANRVHVTVRAGGNMLAARDLDLAGDPDRLPGGIVSGWIDLGPIREGTTVELEVRDDFGLGSIRSHIVVNNCDIGRGTATCLEAGCATETSLPIVAAECMGQGSVQAR
jgi:hypothetical protein